MTIRQMDKKLRKAGFELVSQNKHRKYKHPKRVGHIAIPNHGMGQEIANGMCRRLLKEAGIR